MCVTTTHWATHVSTECAVGGSGQCDGWCATHEHIECTCSCHNDWDLPQTVEAVRDWHDEQESVIASFDTEADALTAHAGLLNKENYRVLAGQDRVVIAERY